MTPQSPSTDKGKDDFMTGDDTPPRHSTPEPSQHVSLQSETYTAEARKIVAEVALALFLQRDEKAIEYITSVLRRRDLDARSPVKPDGIWLTNDQWQALRQWMRATRSHLNALTNIPPLAKTFEAWERSAPITGDRS